MTNATMKKTLNQYLALCEQITALEAQKQALGDKLKQIMGDNEEMQIGEHVARYKAITSARFDSATFKQTHPKLYQAFLKPQTVKRFSIA